MLYKIITLAIIFFVLRNFFKSWKFLNEMQREQDLKKNNPSKNQSAKSGGRDDIIDAEYTVVDK